MSVLHLVTSLAVAAGVAVAAYQAPSISHRHQVDTTVVGTDGELGLDANGDASLDADIQLDSAIELEARP